MLKFQEENKTLKAILNSLAEGVVVTDTSGKFLFMNPIAKQIIGIGPKNVKPEEAVSEYGVYHLDKVTLYSPEKLPLVRAMKGEEIKHEVIFIKNRKRPKGIYIDFSATPLRDSKGAIKGGTIIFRDITERTLAEEELRKLSNAVEQTADSVLITDARGVIEYVNPAFEKTTGYSSKEVIGKTPRILKSGYHDIRFYKYLWDTVSSGNIFYERILNKKKNNELYWSAQTITPMKDKDGNISNYVSVLRDITEIVERQKQDLELKISREQTRKLEEMDHIKSRFFANISHEFRTPLTLILGQVDSVMSSDIEVKEKGKLQVANRNARRLLTLINQILDISKIETGNLELNAEPHNVVSFLTSLLYSFESLAELKKIKLTFDSEFENLTVIFDPDKMEKVFYNLLSNAFKFTPINGEIKVVVKELKDSTVEIKIKDTGIGIPANRLPKIFDRFYQVDGSQTREHEGTGIGLALAKSLIELHKGKISVNSKEGEGSEFIIALPRGKIKCEKERLVDLQFNGSSSTFINYDLVNADAGTNHTELANINNKNKEIILLVEDNSDVRAYICEQLEKDYQVFEAVDGEDGFLKAQREIPDLIITDVMMPKMNGYQFSGKIRSDEKTSHIPIIMLTAKAGFIDKIEGLETGIDAYLIKPFSLKELRVRIKNLIDQRKQLRKRFTKSTIIKPSEVSTLSSNQIFLEKTLAVIEKNFEDEKFSVEILADKVNMSLSQLNRKLNALIDQPAGKLINSFRLQRAADLLKKNTGRVAEICFQVGFNDQSYFARTFKKQFGCSPTTYKKLGI